MLPQHTAVSRHNASGAGGVQHHHLSYSADSQQLRGTVAPTAFRLNPALIAGGDVVGDEPARGRDDYNVIHHERRAREAPARKLGTRVGCRVASPHDRAAFGIECVQDSRCT